MSLSRKRARRRRVQIKEAGTRSAVESMAFTTQRRAVPRYSATGRTTANVHVGKQLFVICRKASKWRAPLTPRHVRRQSLDFCAASEYCADGAQWRMKWPPRWPTISDCRHWRTTTATRQSRKSSTNFRDVCAAAMRTKFCASSWTMHALPTRRSSNAIEGWSVGIWLLRPLCSLAWWRPGFRRAVPRSHPLRLRVQRQHQMSQRQRQSRDRLLLRCLTSRILRAKAGQNYVNHRGACAASYLPT